MKKLKTLIFAALAVGGTCVAFGFNHSLIERGSTVWFDTSSVADCSDYHTVYILYRDSYDEWVGVGSPLLQLADACICSTNFEGEAGVSYDGGELSFTENLTVGNVAGSWTGQTASNFAILFADDVRGYFLVDPNDVSYMRTTGLGNQDTFTINMQEEDAFTSADLKLFGLKYTEAVSDEGWLDLTVGDRVAEVPEELVVVDPAWGEATSATVDFAFGASTVETRTYNCASNDLWETTTLTPGRYTLALTAGTDNETAAFWKTGDDWVIFDNSNITADVTFEADKTYLMLGTNTVSGKTLTVTDGAKFAYGEGAGFLGGTVAALPKRYMKVVKGDLYQIFEKIKGSEDNPWEVGVGVEAYTNGTELVIQGEGTIMNLTAVPIAVRAGTKAVTIVDATVTGAAAGAFFGFADGILLTLPDNWKGELPDEKGTWCGATNVELAHWPMAVKNVKVQQRYPWNGLVDVDFDLSGSNKVAVTLSVMTNGVKAVANPTVTGDTTVDLGDGKELKDLRITWDTKTDFKDEEMHEKIKVKLSVSSVESD